MGIRSHWRSGGRGSGLVGSLVSSRFDITASVRQAWDDQRDARRWVIAAFPFAGLFVGFGLANAGVPRLMAGAVVVGFGVVAAVLMGRRGWPWRVPVAGAVYATAFALSHPLALAIGTWPAVALASLVSGAVTYEVTPPRR